MSLKIDELHLTDANNSICFTEDNCWNRCFRWRLRILWRYISLICLQRVKRQTMTEVEAFTACNDAFQQSTYYDTCLSIVPNFSNETIVNCIRDLTVSLCFWKHPYTWYILWYDKNKTMNMLYLLLTGNWGSQSNETSSRYSSRAMSRIHFAQHHSTRWKPCCYNNYHQFVS